MYLAFYVKRGFDVNKRLIIKTSLICFGVFMFLASLGAWLLVGKIVNAKDITVDVIVAGVKIEKGIIITEKMLTKKSIPIDSKNNFMVEQAKDIIGTKANITTEAGDYIRIYSLVNKENWFKEDDRITVLPMEVEERMANLIIKNSYIDIKMVPKTVKSLPISVLSKVRVDDVIDENGVSLGGTGVNKKAYVKVVLSKEQRDRLFTAREMGRLIYELYCDEGQKKPEEEFKIPHEFL